MDVRMPDGMVITNVPDGVTQAELMKMIGSYQRTDAPPIKIGKDAFADTLRQTLRDANWLPRNLAAMGSSVTSLWEGAKQFAGKADPQQIEADKIIAQEAPIGRALGDAALTAMPFGWVGKSLPGAAAVGAGMGLMQPVSGEQTSGNIVRGKTANAGIGAASALAGQMISNKAGQMIADKAKALGQAKMANAPMDATIKEAIDAGYVIPPGQVNPTLFNRTLESVGGKIATQQIAATKNQATTDTLARSAVGLLPNAPLTPKNLAAMRTKLGAAYNDVAKYVGPDTVEALKTLRADANEMWRMQARNPHPETLAQAKVLTERAQWLEQTIDQALNSIGKKDVMQKFRAARQAIAVNHAVEDALVQGGGTIDARAIAKLAQRGEPLSGELSVIGNFANNFPKITQPDKMIGTPDAHNLKYIASLLLGSGGGATMGPFGGIAMGALPLVAGPVARAAMFSRPMQRGLLNSYELGMLPRVSGGLLQYTPVASTVAGLNTFRQ